MADMQMKLLRKKIQKRNEKNKKRQLTLKQTEDEDAGMSWTIPILPVDGYASPLSELVVNFSVLG